MSDFFKKFQVQFFVLFWHKNIGAKSALKMLVKLTPSCHFILYYWLDVTFYFWKTNLKIHFWKMFWSFILSLFQCWHHSHKRFIILLHLSLSSLPLFLSLLPFSPSPSSLSLRFSIQTVPSIKLCTWPMVGKCQAWR